MLRQLAVAGAAGGELQATATAALRQAAILVGLKAAAVYLWDESMTVNLSVAYAEAEEYGHKLSSLEEDLFAGLRRDRHLVAAYLSFGGETPMQSFTLPLRHGGKVFGAVIGIGEGERRLVTEDLFLEAFKRGPVAERSGPRDRPGKVTVTRTARQRAPECRAGNGRDRQS